MDGGMITGERGGTLRGFRVPGTGTHEPSRPPGRAPKVFLYSHDTFGLGHLRRNLAIAEELLAGGFAVWLLTGSPVIRSWPLPAGLSVQPLPPVVKLGAERYGPRSGTDPFALCKGYREALILKTVLREEPDVLLVDHAPSGMKGELLSTLSLIRNELPATRVILGLRDILDSPETVRELWRVEETYELIARAYDEVIVYGCRGLYDVGHAYGLEGLLGSRLRYAGYVARAAAPAPAGVPAWPAAAQGRRVLVTAGGGGDGHFLMEAFLDALALLPSGATSSVVLTGPLMGSEDYASLATQAAGRGDVRLITRSDDVPALMAQADLVVSMGGYNSSVEILAARKPAIIVPRAAPRAEQRIRAEILAGLGLVWTAAPGAGLAGRLAGVLPKALSGQRDIAPRWEALDLGGARRVRELIGMMTAHAPAAEYCA